MIGRVTGRTQLTVVTQADAAAGVRTTVTPHAEWQMYVAVKGLRPEEEMVAERLHDIENAVKGLRPEAEMVAARLNDIENVLEGLIWGPRPTWP